MKESYKRGHFAYSLLFEGDNVGLYRLDSEGRKQGYAVVVEGDDAYEQQFTVEEKEVAVALYNSITGDEPDEEDLAEEE